MASKETVAEQDWVPARLIPAGKMRQDEQERKATSVFLAVMPAVPSFARGLLSELKAPAGKVSTFTEVRLKDPAGKVHIPDGAIVVERGKTRWSCLVEVKTGRVSLEGPQVERYLEMAREHDFDALLTVSNQIRSETEGLPYEVDKRKVGKLTVRHISWWRILTEAIVQHRFRGVSDPEQAWILNELIRYLDDEMSGAGGFEGMGEEWVKVREGVRHETLRRNDPQAQAIAARWEHFLEYLCLRLSQDLGVSVKQHRPGRRSAQERLKGATNALAADGVLTGAIKVPDAVGPVTVEADLRARRVTTSVEIDAPKDKKRPTARVNWLLRQLADAPDDLRIAVRFAQTRSTTADLLGAAREDPAKLLLADDPKREPRSFILARSLPMGLKGDLRKGSFVAETRKQTMDFYGELVQDLRPPQPKAPKLPEKEEEQHPPDIEPATSEGQALRQQREGLEEIAELGDFAPLS